MSYDPYQPPATGPYQQPGGYPPPERRRDGASMVIRIVRLITAVTTTIFTLHIVFVVLEANQGNEFVSFIYTLAKGLVLGLGDVFTPDDAKIGVVLNYGFAAVIYLIVGQFVIKALRRD